MKKLQKGFTLIELMIVIAIIGILAAFALPAYSNYIARTQASEAFTIMDGLKTDATIEYANNGSNCLAGGTKYGGKYVNDITLGAAGAALTVGGASGPAVPACTYLATYKAAVSAKIANKIVAFGYFPASGAGSENWACYIGGQTTLDPNYNSKQCL